MDNERNDVLMNNNNEDFIKVNVVDGALSDEEIEVYVKQMIDKHGEDKIDSITIKVDGEYVDVETHLKTVKPFQRIRRITGYLTNLNRANNAKTAEIADRVKHG